MRNYEFLQAKTYARQFPVVFPPGTARACARRACAPCVRMQCGVVLSRLRSPVGQRTCVLLVCACMRVMCVARLLYVHGRRAEHGAVRARTAR